MATGTTPVTGTVRTGMTGMRPPQPRQPMVGKVLQWWAGLKPKQRMMVMGLAVLCVIIAISLVKVQKATAYVNLYENALSTDDLQDVSQSLAAMGVDYRKTQDSHLLVPPSKRVHVLAELIKQGIPRHPFYQPKAGETGKTHEEFTLEQQRLLERDITLVLRQFNEIADANVKLVIPSDTANFFKDDKETAKAAVMLKLKPGYDKLPLNEARSIVNMVAAAVPKLSPENVQLMDTNGKLMSDMLKRQEDTTSSDVRLDYKQKYQAQLENQVRQILDKSLGPDKYAVTVNVEFDWNQWEKNSRTVGNPEMNVHGIVPVIKKTHVEKYSKNGGSSSSGPRQLSYGSATANNGDYENRTEEAKNEYNEEKVRTIGAQGVPSLITASVLADDTLSESAIRTYSRMIKNAIGINDERGDRVSFGTLPFHRGEIEDLAKNIGTPIAFRNSSGVPADFVLKAVLAVAIACLFLGGIYLFRQQKAQMEQQQLLLAAGPATTVSDISDLLNEKSGKTVAPLQARAQQTERLEQLVKEKPTRVAELLKTTWLAEK